MDKEPQFKTLREIRHQNLSDWAIFVTLSSAGVVALYYAAAGVISHPDVQLAIQQAVQNAQSLK